MTRQLAATGGATISSEGGYLGYRAGSTGQVTLDGAGTPATGHSVWLTRRDLTANTWTIADSALGTIIVLPASPATPVAVCVTWNGANWGSSPSSVQYLTA